MPEARPEMNLQHWQKKFLELAIQAVRSGKKLSITLPPGRAWSIFIGQQPPPDIEEPRG